jgi:hypothetical protein
MRHFIIHYNSREEARETAHTRVRTKKQNSIVTDNTGIPGQGSFAANAELQANSFCCKKPLCTLNSIIFCFMLGVFTHHSHVISSDLLLESRYVSMSTCSHSAARAAGFVPPAMPKGHTFW